MWTPGQVREAGPQLLDLAGLGLLGARPGPHPVASRCPDQNGGSGVDQLSGLGRTLPVLQHTLPWEPHSSHSLYREWSLPRVPLG